MCDLYDLDDPWGSLCRIHGIDKVVYDAFKIDDENMAELKKVFDELEKESNNGRNSKVIEIASARRQRACSKSS